MKCAVRVLHVLWMALQTANELCDRSAIEADLKNSSEKRKPV